MLETLDLPFAMIGPGFFTELSAVNLGHLSNLTLRDTTCWHRPLLPDIRLRIAGRDARARLAKAVEVIVGMRDSVDLPAAVMAADTIYGLHGIR